MNILPAFFLLAGGSPAGAAPAPVQIFEESKGCSPEAFWLGKDRSLVFTMCGKAFDLDTKELVYKYPLPKKARTDMRVSPDGGKLAVLGIEGLRKVYLSIIDIQTGKFVVNEEKITKLSDNAWERRDFVGSAWLSAQAKHPEIEPYNKNGFSYWNMDKRFAFGEAPFRVVYKDDDVYRSEVVMSVRGAAFDTMKFEDPTLLFSLDARYLAFIRVYKSDDDRLQLIDLGAAAPGPSGRREARGKLSPADAALQKGYDLASVKNYREASTSFSDALELKPGWAKAHLLRALALWELGDPKCAGEIDAALEADPELDSEELQALRESAGTLAKLSAPLKKDPKDESARRARARFHLARGSESPAASDLLELRRLGGKLSADEERFVSKFWAKYYYDRALRMFEAGMSAAAADECDDALKYEPGNAEVRSLRSQAKADYKERTKLKSAEELIREARQNSALLNFDLAGFSRAILAGSRAVGSGSSSSGSGSSYSPSSRAGGSPSRASSAGRSSAPDYDAQVRERVEKKLWDMNNPFNKR